MNDIVSLAKEIAERAHAGQFRRDKTTPYIRHPEAVARRVSGHPEAEATAWLHDVLEDSDETVESLLSKGVPPEIVESVRRLTKVPGVSYEEYLARVRSDSVACKVKIADMLTNLSDDPTSRQIRKYAKGLLFLTDRGG